VSFISLSRVSKSFGPFMAISDLSLDIEAGEFISIVGPSGCGKSTLLQIIGGLIAPSGGEIRLKDKRVTRPPREMVYVFQQYNRSLFPWRSVRRNIAFGLEGTGLKRSEIDRKCSEYVELVGLKAFERHLPHQLSGGMQQRVAVARALAFGADVMLMDEPFGSVDAQTRAGLQDLLLQLWEKYGFTVLFVTHDIDEAIYVAQKVLVLSSAPAQIRTTVATNLAYPRHQVRTKEAGQYLAHRRQMYSLLFPESSTPSESDVQMAARG
jgi:NitT/TauT family transport system ATP-binding protein